MFERLFHGLPKGEPFVDKEYNVTCHVCKKSFSHKELFKADYVCPECGANVRVPARDRIRMVADDGSFYELDRKLTSVDFLDFPGYKEKISKAIAQTGELSAVVTGVMRVGGLPCAVFAMDSRFIMASMGSAVGEKITRLFEYATKMKLPVLGFTCSGGARMQEGVTSLMQMAKCSGAIRRHSDEGLLYIAYLTDPTTGGITASIAAGGCGVLSNKHRVTTHWRLFAVIFWLCGRKAGCDKIIGVLLDFVHALLLYIFKIRLFQFEFCPKGRSLQS